jgi:hypothetical protein
LLGSTIVQNILKGRRDIGIVIWGVAMFIPDEDIAHMAQYLYEWSGPKSCLAFNAQASSSVDTDDPAIAQTLKTYKQMGSTIYMRTLDQYAQLLQPWKLDGKGFIPFLEWHHFDQSVMPDNTGGSGGNCGAYLIK